jgi:hypothetical protein
MYKQFILLIYMVTANYALAETKWKTYTNREFCYSVEYPSDWKLEKQDSHGFGIYFPGTLPPVSYSDNSQGGYILIYGLNVSLEESFKMTMDNLERNNRMPRSLSNFPLKLTKPKFQSSNQYAIGGAGSEGEIFFHQSLSDALNRHNVNVVTFVYKDHAIFMHKLISDHESRILKSIRFGC